MPIHELICRDCKQPFLIDTMWVENQCPECFDKEFNNRYNKGKL